jgi:hypothetical protein
MDAETYFDGRLTFSPTSRRSRDLASLKQLRKWLDNPVFSWDTSVCRRMDETGDDFAEAANRLRAARREAINKAAAEQKEAAAE